jgi:hypothetical protein
VTRPEQWVRALPASTRTATTLPLVESDVHGIATEPLQASLKQTGCHNRGRLGNFYFDYKLSANAIKHYKLIRKLKVGKDSGKGNIHEVAARVGGWSDVHGTPTL